MHVALGAFAGLAAGRVEVAGGQHGHVLLAQAPHGVVRGQGPVVGGNALAHAELALVGRFAGHRQADVAVAQKRHGADHQRGAATGFGQGHHLLGGVGGHAAHHVDAQPPQQLPRGVEQGGGVVVAAHHHNVAAIGALHLHQEIVVQLLGRVRGRGGVEHVAGHHQRFHAVGLHGPQQPDKKRPLLGQALLPGEEVLAQVPVGGVQYAHLIV